MLLRPIVGARAVRSVIGGIAIIKVHLPDDLEAMFCVGDAMLGLAPVRCC